MAYLLKAYGKNGVFDEAQLPSHLDLCRKYRAYLEIRGKWNDYGMKVGVALLPSTCALRVLPSDDSSIARTLTAKALGIQRQRDYRKLAFYGVTKPDVTAEKILKNLLGYLGIEENALLIAIDLDSNATKVKQDIDEILKIHLRKEQVKPLPLLRWARDLVIYDIHGLTRSSRRIIDFVAQLYGDEAVDELTKDSVRRKKDDIQALIDGQYKKYI